jgi:hypothetical protein
MIKDNDLEDKKEANREKQRRFYNLMVGNGFKRRHNWFSKRSQEILDELAENYTKEVIIQEALELLILAQKKWPDTVLTSSSELDHLRQLMQATKRHYPEHFELALAISNKRIERVKKALDSFPNDNDNPKKR